MQKLVPAFQTLYGSLSDQQKKTADQMFRNYAANDARPPPGAPQQVTGAALAFPRRAPGAICRPSRRRSVSAAPAGAVP